MNKNQIFRIELEKKKTSKLNAEVQAKQYLLKARENPEFCEIDNQIRKLQLELSKENDKQKYADLKNKISFLKIKADAVLSKIKFDKTLLEPKYSCPICKDSGYVGDKICECLNFAVEQALVKQTGINDSLKFSFNNCDEQILQQNANLDRAYKIAKKYIAEFPNFKFPNLVFVGDVGTGKTFLLECMANELNNNMHYVVFSTAFDVNKTMVNSFSVSASERENLLAPFFESELLIIDDLGSEPILKNTTISNLFTIINERQRANRPTIISTNLTPTQIQDRYGDRIASRIFNKRICLPLQFVGKDLRINN